jgi:hypothetical protein
LAGSVGVANESGATSGVGVDAGGDGVDNGVGVGDGAGAGNGAGVGDEAGVGDGGVVTSWANRIIGSKITKSRPRIRSLMRNVNGTKQERSQHLGS